MRHREFWWSATTWNVGSVINESGPSQHPVTAIIRWNRHPYYDSEITFIICFWGCQLSNYVHVDLSANVWQCWLRQVRVGHDQNGRWRVALKSYFNPDIGLQCTNDLKSHIMYISTWSANLSTDLRVRVKQYSHDYQCIQVCMYACWPRLADKTANITTCDGSEIPWQSSVRYLGVYIAAGSVFSCEFDNAKKSFYRAFNAVFGKLVAGQAKKLWWNMMKFKCMPMLMYDWKCVQWKNDSFGH